VAIHDVIAERHPRMVFARRRYQLMWRLKLALAVRQASLVLTVSDHARAGIMTRFKLRPDRVRVIVEAPDPVFRSLTSPREPADLLPGVPPPRGSRYLLYVGGISPHKNLPTLVEAFRRLTADGAFGDLHLLLVGDYRGDVFFSAYEGLRGLIDRLGLGPRVHFTGFVPDEPLVDLYNRAEVLVLPSLEEGFGLPAFEAAACGTPVVVSETGPAAALLGGGAWSFPPRDAAALTAALGTLLADPGRREVMGREARRRAAELSWERAAAELHAILREVASG